MSERYSRQQLFAPIGSTGQAKLAQKHVLIVGAGALGASSSEVLVRAGIGKLTILDRDYVEWSNLQRQQLYCEEDARNRMPKAIAAQKRLQLINSEVEINGLVMDADHRELLKLAKDVDLILDATDNFEIRMIINDVSQKLNIPWIYGSAVGSYGIAATIIPGKTPCLNCMLDTVPMAGETCDTSGIIAPAIGMVVAYQTAEALKICVEDWQAVRDKLVAFNVWSNEFSAIPLHSLKRTDCPSCGEGATYPYLKRSNLSMAAVLCGRDTVQIRPPVVMKHDLAELASRLKPLGDKVESNPYLVSFTIGKHRLAIFEDGRVLVHGTSDTAEARSLVHRYLG